MNVSTCLKTLDFLLVLGYVNFFIFYHMRGEMGYERYFTTKEKNIAGVISKHLLLLLVIQAIKYKIVIINDNKIKITKPVD